MSHTICNEENKEINIGDVYKLLQQSSQDISKKIDGLETKLENIEQKYDTTITELKEKVEIFENENKQLKARLINVERKLKQKNLIFYGIHEEEGENIVCVLEKLFEEKLEVKIEKYEITNAFRMGRDVNKPRPILIELLSGIKRREIISRKQKLKGTNIFISEDLTLEDRQERKVLIEQLKLARSKDKLAQLKGNKLIIEGEIYSYSDLIKNKDNSLHTGYYSPPPAYIVTSVPATPSGEAKDKKEYESEHSTEGEDLQLLLVEPIGKPINEKENLLMQKESTKEQEKENIETGIKKTNSDTEEKKRKLQVSPTIITGTIPKVPRTLSGSKNQKQ